MSDAPRSKGTDNVLCKICNHRHAFREPHIFGSKPPAPSIRTIDVTPRKTAPSPSGKAPDFDSGTVRSNRAGATKPKRAKAAKPKKPRKRPAIAVAHTIKELKKMADDASDRIAKKPAKRGPKPGAVPFDKKAHDRQKAAERRAAKKAGA